MATPAEICALLDGCCRNFTDKQFKNFVLTLLCAMQSQFGVATVVLCDFVEGDPDTYTPFLLVTVNNGDGTTTSTPRTIDNTADYTVLGEIVICPAPE